jgi:hypothetical protein
MLRNYSLPAAPVERVIREIRDGKVKEERDPKVGFYCFCGKNSVLQEDIVCGFCASQPILGLCRNHGLLGRQVAMLFRTPIIAVTLLAAAWLVCFLPASAQAGSLLGVYAPATPDAPRFFAAVFDGDSDRDRQETAKAGAAIALKSNISVNREGDWLACPFLVGSQKLMVGCVGADGALHFYVTASCQGNKIGACGYRRDAEAVPEYVPPGRGRDFQMGWEEITIGNFFNSFNVQFRCHTVKH